MPQTNETKNRNFILSSYWLAMWQHTMIIMVIIKIWDIHNDNLNLKKAKKINLPVSWKIFWNTHNLFVQIFSIQCCEKSFKNYMKKSLSIISTSWVTMEVRTFLWLVLSLMDMQRCDQLTAMGNSLWFTVYGDWV